MKELLLIQRKSYLPHSGWAERVSSLYLKILALAFDDFSFFDLFIGFGRSLSKTLSMIYEHYIGPLISYKNNISNNKIFRSHSQLKHSTL